MLFSIVIPLYNKADTIRRAVRSVWEQSFKDFELIVVNDGSTDASLEAVMKLANEKAIRVIDRPNGGVSSARNAGAAVANGEYVALLDADDCWANNYLLELSLLIRDNPDAVLVGTGFYWNTREKCYRVCRTNNSNQADILRETAIFQPFHTSSVAIRRKEYREVGGFDENHSYYEDIEFVFKIAIKWPKSIYISSRPLVYHMDDATYSITKTVKCSFLDYPHLALIERTLNYCDCECRKSIAYFAAEFAISQAAINVRRNDFDMNCAFRSRFPRMFDHIRCKKLFLVKYFSYITLLVSYYIAARKYLLRRKVLKKASKDEVLTIRKQMMRWL